ncbi:integral membrane protein GPR180 isoform X2 [Carassius gibelio]|uniref:integral membrane protein GPR180 isoform X2 n=1 Tax=Carassius gibelio TaxID=101364 RepID=UPI0022795D54|nr:integral membrane protein GPR180 isoform X2 [Carassius gibelio]
MFVYFIIIIVLLFTSCPAAGKTVSGIFRSDAARENNGQYITRFLYHGENGLVMSRVDNVLLAVEKEARLLLFQGSEGLDNLSCLQRLASAHISIKLMKEEQNQTIPHQSGPQAWHVMYVDQYTCQDGEMDGVLEDLRFQISLMNPDAAGNPLDHFSAEETGLHSFYFLLILAYFVASCIYIQPLWQALSKAGPMHTVLKVLSTTLLLQGTSVLLNYIHMSRYARDGVGTPLMGSLAEWGAADLGAAGGRRAPQLPHTAQCSRLAADGPACGPRSVPGVCAVSDHLYRAERAQTRLLPELRQGLFPVVPVSSGAGPVLSDSQRTPERKGGDDRRDPVPVHLSGGSVSSVPVTQSVLGSVLAVVGHAAAHHEPPEPLLSIRPQPSTPGPMRSDHTTERR